MNTKSRSCRSERGTLLPWVFIASQVFPLLIPLSYTETLKGHLLLLQWEVLKTLRSSVRMRKAPPTIALYWEVVLLRRVRTAITGPRTSGASVQSSCFSEHTPHLGAHCRHWSHVAILKTAKKEIIMNSGLTRWPQLNGSAVLVHVLRRIIPESIRL